MLPEFRLRPRVESDDPFLLELFQDVRAVEFLPLCLPESTLQQMLTLQFRAQASGYATHFPRAEDLVVWHGDQPIGRLLVNRTDDAIHLLDIALLENFRGHGIGTRLLNTLIAEGNERGLPVRLFVRANSPAALLYERLGFAVTGADELNVAMERTPRGGDR